MIDHGSSVLAGGAKRTSWREAACGALAAMLCALPVPALASDLAGLWLIEPDSFDAMVENGADLPAYPLLVIRDDHVFRLYRAFPRCVPLDHAGEELSEVREFCYLVMADNGRDELYPGARLTAEGTWEQASDGHIRFVSHSIAPVPQWWRHEILPRVMEGQRPPDMPVADWRRLEDAGRTYYTSFHVGDGAWIAVTRQGDVLTLARAGQQDLRYRRTSGAAISQTMAVLDVFNLSGGAYFRCLLGLVEGTRQGAPDRTELTRLLALATWTRTAAIVHAYASALRLGDQDAEADRIFPEADEDAFNETIGAIRAHPLFDSDTAGVFFGCPERDHWLDGR